MSLAKRLEQISSGLFFVGFLISKLEHLPLVTISGIFNLVALTMYLLGYIFWISASYIFPEHTQRTDRWYGFSQFKDQYKVAATIGTIATLLFIGAMFVPIINIPALWIFVISNGVWFTAEYHKLQHPPTYDKQFSPEKQRSYLYFAMMITLLSVVAAIAGTIAFACPPIAIMVLTVSTVISLVLGAAAVMYWFDSNFPTTKYSAEDVPDVTIKSTYNQINDLTKAPSLSPTQKKLPVIEYQKDRNTAILHGSVYSDNEDNEKEQNQWNCKPP